MGEEIPAKGGVTLQIHLPKPADCRLIWYDQIVSDSHLLGYVNADHWGIVLAVGEKIPVAEPFVRDDVPRVALIEGAIDVVAASLPPAPESADVNRDHVETP